MIFGDSCGAALALPFLKVSSIKGEKWKPPVTRLGMLVKLTLKFFQKSPDERLSLSYT
jgi:hypothetical protein